jgi:hypothetical protein
MTQTQPGSTRTCGVSPFFFRYMPGFGIALSLIALALSGVFLFAQPQGLAFGAASAQGGGGPSLAPLFGLARAPEAKLASPARILAGINGEAAPAKPSSAAPDEIIAPPGSPDIEPAAWELPSGRCVTLTTKSGETFAFRIVGAQAASRKSQAGEGAVELAVASCAKETEPIVKVVIEPDAGAGQKQPARERNL